MSDSGKPVGPGPYGEPVVDPYAPQQYPSVPQYGAPPTPYGYPAQYPPGPQPGYQQFGAPLARATNGLAIASMVCGIVWIYWLGSVLAIIFGFVARAQIRQRNERGDGMAVAGIVLGFVGLAFLLLAIIVLA